MSSPPVCNEIKGTLESEVWIVAPSFTGSQCEHQFSQSKKAGNNAFFWGERKMNWALMWQRLCKTKIARRKSKLYHRGSHISFQENVHLRLLNKVETHPYFLQCGCTSKAFLSFSLPILSEIILLTLAWSPSGHVQKLYLSFPHLGLPLCHPWIT